MKCPVCGSEMELKSSEFKVKIGYGTASSKIHINVCPDCGYDIDEKSNKKIIAETINRSNYECAYKILEFLKASGKNFSEIERKFNLPSRTLSKWVNKKIKPSASAITLLRIIRAFPWMEKAADLQFDSKEAQEYVYNYYLSKFDSKDKKIRYAYYPKTRKHLWLVVMDDKDDKDDICADRYINVTNDQKTLIYEWSN